MHKHIILASLLGFCLLSLTACQRSENKPVAAPTDGTSAEQTTVNPGPEANTNTTMNENQQQPAQELAATSTPSSPDNTMSNQTPATNNTSTPGTTGNTTLPSDQSGNMQNNMPNNNMQNNMPNNNMPADQNPTAGTDTSKSSSDNNPNPDNNTDNTDMGSNTTK